MIISNSQQFAFIHNPKVAGSSIRKMLLPFNESPMELWHQRHIPELMRIVDTSHLSAAEMETLHNHQYIYCPDNYFRFGFARDPYARFQSALREYSRQHSVDLSTRESLEAFVLNNLTPISVQFDWRFSHFRPQHHYFYNGRKRVTDFIGRFHCLKEDLKAVSAILNLGLNLGELGMERDTGHQSLVSDPLATFGKQVLERINFLYAMDWLLLSPYFPSESRMVGDLPNGSHWVNVENFRSPAGRFTYYGEPPNLTLGEKVGFLTAEVERLRALAGVVPEHLKEARRT